jgi:hypothetical protein
MRRFSSLNVLHQNSFGHIAKCRCYQEIQICLGNVILTFSEQEYLEFDAFFYVSKRGH